MSEQPTAAHPRIVSCGPVAGYSPPTGRYVALLTEVRQHLLEEVDGLTISQRDWHPDDQTETIGTLLLDHLAHHRARGSPRRSRRVAPSPRTASLRLIRGIRGPPEADPPEADRIP